MTIPLSPRLVGETEKALNTLLDRFLDGTGLSEPQWVTLRIAGSVGDAAAAHDLAAAVAARARFSDADEIVRGLTDRGLLDEGQLTRAGSDLVATVQDAIDTGTAPIWDDLSPDDVAATTRVLNQVLDRTRRVLDADT